LKFPDSFFFKNSKKMSSTLDVRQVAATLDASRNEALAGNYDSALIMFDGVLAAIQRYVLMLRCWLTGRFSSLTIHAIL
jgi:hypothetical protein